MDKLYQCSNVPLNFHVLQHIFQFQNVLKGNKRQTILVCLVFAQSNFTAVTWLKYCRYGVKLYPINQSIKFFRCFLLNTSRQIDFLFQKARNQHSFITYVIIGENREYTRPTKNSKSKKMPKLVFNSFDLSVNDVS